MSPILNEIRLPGQRAVHQSGSAIVDIQSVTLRYETRTVLESVSFQLQTGDRVAVIGPNGAGKSTLFKIIAGVLAPSNGKVNVYGQGPDGHICISYLPQRSQVDWQFPVNVADVVMMGRIGQLGLLRWPRRRDWDLVHTSLEIVGLAELANRQISELSGGQQQRMFIARALAQEAELMLMDEPLSGLDARSEEIIYNLLDELQENSVTILVAMHDLDQAATQFEQVMLLNRRIIGFGKPQDVFTTENLLLAYGGHLHMIRDETGLLLVGDSCCDEGEEE